MRRRSSLILLSLALVGLLGMPAAEAGSASAPEPGAFVVVLREPVAGDPASAMPGQLALVPLLEALRRAGSISAYELYLGVNAISVWGDVGSRLTLAAWPGVARVRGAESDVSLARALSAADLAPAAGTARIQGVVTGPGGAPLSGIEVKAYRYNNVIWVMEGTATTGAGGAYDIGALPSGVYKVGFSDPAGNYVPEYYDNQTDLYAATPFNLAEGQVKTGINASLEAAGRIAGTLTDSADGKPVATFGAGAWRLSGATWVLAGYSSSGADGKYVIGGLPAGSYRVKFSDVYSPPRYLTEYYNNVTEINLATPVNVVAGQTTSNINASLGGYGKMTGKVTAPDGTTGLSDIAVDVYQYNAVGGFWDWASSTSTDSSGNYQVEGLVTRDYRVEFSDPLGQYVGEFYADKATVEAADDVHVELGATTANINASLAPRTVTLERGLANDWNLIAIPLNLPAPAPADALASLSSSLSLVYAYDGCQPADPWRKYDPLAPPFTNNLTAIGVQQGLWVQTTAPVTLTVTGVWPAVTSISLCTGWNLIGYPSITSRSVSTALSSIAGKYNLVYAYDATDTADPWKVYNPALPPYANDLKELKPGAGYWIRMTAPGTLTVPGR